MVTSQKHHGGQIAKQDREAASFRLTRRVLERHQSAAKRRGLSGSSFCLSTEVLGVYGVLEGSNLDSERGLLEYALAFVNGDTDRSVFRTWLQTNKDAQSWILEKADSDEHDVEHVLLLDDRVVTRHRNQLKDLLVNVLDGAGSISDQDLRIIEKQFESIWVLPVLARSGSTVTMSSQVLMPNHSAFHAYISVLFLDQTRPFGQDLCRCKLDDCGKFFLMKQAASGGRPQRLYHSKDCMDLAHARNSTARAQLSRAKKKASNKPGRKSK